MLQALVMKVIQSLDTCVSNSAAVKTEMPLRIANTGNRLMLVVEIGLATHIMAW
jgi:hypothetical protein